MTSRLLVMACGARKRGTIQAAIDLYDGSAYRVLRKRNVGFGRVPVLILSAEHGLIPASKKIAPYDRKMDALRADELVEGVVHARQLVAATPGWPYSEVFCHCGSLYRHVLEAYQLAGVFGRAKVRFSGGRIGEQLSQLVKFLEGQ